MSASSRTPFVAGVSGSPASHRAVEAAAEVAHASGYPLLLVHAFNWLPTLSSPRPDAGDVLRRAVAVAARTAPALTVMTELVEGAPLNGLLRRSRHAALTVIGDGDLNSRVCLPADALAVQFVARAPATVMVTRAAPPPEGPIVVGVDGSASAERTLDFAFDIAAHRRAKLIVVHTRDTLPAADDRPGARATAVEDLIATRAHHFGSDIQVHLADGDPIAVLRREAEKAALVIVGARGQLPYRGLLGSVAQALLHHSPAPIVVVRGTVPAAHRQKEPQDGGTQLRGCGILV